MRVFTDVLAALTLPELAGIMRNYCDELEETDYMRELLAAVRDEFGDPRAMGRIHDAIISSLTCECTIFRAEGQCRRPSIVFLFDGRTWDTGADGVWMCARCDAEWAEQVKQRLALPASQVWR